MPSSYTCPAVTTRSSDTNLRLWNKYLATALGKIFVGDQVKIKSSGEMCSVTCVHDHMVSTTSQSKSASKSTAGNFDYADVESQLHLCPNWSLAARTEGWLGEALFIHEARYGWASDLWAPQTCSHDAGCKDVTDIVRGDVAANWDTNGCYELYFNRDSFILPISPTYRSTQDRVRDTRPSSQHFWPGTANKPATPRMLGVRYSYGQAGKVMQVTTRPSGNETMCVWIKPKSCDPKASPCSKVYAAVDAPAAVKDGGSGSTPAIPASEALIIHEARYGWASDLWAPQTCSHGAGCKDVTDIVRGDVSGNEVHLNPSCAVQFCNQHFWPETAGGPAIARRVGVRYSYGQGGKVMQLTTAAKPSETVCVHITLKSSDPKASPCSKVYAGAGSTPTEAGDGRSKPTDHAIETSCGSTEEWVLAAFGPDPGCGWPDAKRIALSAALQEEEFFTSASVAAMEEDVVVMIIKAAGLKAGTSKDFRSALGDLKQGSKEGEKAPSYEEAAAMAGAGAASMKVRLQTVLGKSVVIAVNPKDTVLSVLRVVAEAGLVDGGKTYGLMYGKVTMDLNNTMKDYGVVDGAEMTVTPNTMGSI